VNGAALLVLLTLAAFGFVAGVAHGSESATLCALRALPVAAEDRFAAGKPEQLTAIAAAVERHGRTRTERAFVIAWGWHESAYSMRIGSGRCRPLECDRGRARGPWQNHRLMLTDEQWDRLHGLEHVDAQAAEAVRRARSALAQCGGIVRQAYAVLSGRGCGASLPDLDRRMSSFNSVLRRIQ